LGSILAGALLVPLVTFTGVYIIFMGVCQFYYKAAFAAT
jgi:hypothetical protein